MRLWRRVRKFLWWQMFIAFDSIEFKLDQPWFGRIAYWAMCHHIDLEIKESGHN